MGLPTGSGMCEHQEGQRGPVTDGKGGGLSGPSPFVSPVEMRGWLWRGICDPQQEGILTFFPTHYSACFLAPLKKVSLSTHWVLRSPDLTLSLVPSPLPAGGRLSLPPPTSRKQPSPTRTGSQECNLILVRTLPGRGPAAHVHRDELESSSKKKMTGTGETGTSQPEQSDGAHIHILKRGPHCTIPLLLQCPAESGPLGHLAQLSQGHGDMGARECTRHRQACHDRRATRYSNKVTDNHSGKTLSQS